MQKVLLAALLLAAPCVIAPSAVAEKVERGGDSYAQVIHLEDEQPESGRYQFDFTDTTETRVACGSAHGHPCWGMDRGTQKVKLKTYSVDEHLDRYDIYILEVNVEVTHAGGGNTNKGRMSAIVSSKGPSLVDRSDSVSVSAREADCDEIGVNLSKSIGPISASWDVGTIEFCDEGASVKRTASGRTSTWKPYQLRSIDEYTIVRAVKVNAGALPKFTITFAFPADSCGSTFTAGSGVFCDEVNSRNVVTRTYDIDTVG